MNVSPPQSSSYNTLATGKSHAPQAGAQSGSASTSNRSPQDIQADLDAVGAELLLAYEQYGVGNQTKSRIPTANELHSSTLNVQRNKNGTIANIIFADDKTGKEVQWRLRPNIPEIQGIETKYVRYQELWNQLAVAKTSAFRSEKRKASEPPAMTELRAGKRAQLGPNPGLVGSSGSTVRSLLSPDRVWSAASWPGFELMPGRLPISLDQSILHALNFQLANFRDRQIAGEIEWAQETAIFVNCRKVNAQHIRLRDIRGQLDALPCAALCSYPTNMEEFGQMLLQLRPPFGVVLAEVSEIEGGVKYFAQSGRYQNISISVVKDGIDLKIDSNNIKILKYTISVRNWRDPDPEPFLYNVIHVEKWRDGTALELKDLTHIVRCMLTTSEENPAAGNLSGPLLHCKEGKGRAGLTVGAFLLAVTRRISSAEGLIKSLRISRDPNVVYAPGQIKALADAASRLGIPVTETQLENLLMVRELAVFLKRDPGEIWRDISELGHDERISLPEAVVLMGEKQIEAWYGVCDVPIFLKEHQQSFLEALEDSNSVLLELYNAERGPICRLHFVKNDRISAYRHVYDTLNEPRREEFSSRQEAIEFMKEICANADPDTRVGILSDQKLGKFNLSSNMSSPASSVPSWIYRPRFEAVSGRDEVEFDFQSLVDLHRQIAVMVDNAQRVSDTETFTGRGSADVSAFRMFSYNLLAERGGSPDFCIGRYPASEQVASYLWLLLHLRPSCCIIPVSGNTIDEGAKLFARSGEHGPISFISQELDSIQGAIQEDVPANILKLLGIRIYKLAIRYAFEENRKELDLKIVHLENWDRRSVSSMRHLAIVVKLIGEIHKEYSVMDSERVPLLHYADDAGQTAVLAGAYLMEASPKVYSVERLIEGMVLSGYPDWILHAADLAMFAKIAACRRIPIRELQLADCMLANGLAALLELDRKDLSSLISKLRAELPSDGTLLVANVIYSLNEKLEEGEDIWYATLSSKKIFDEPEIFASSLKQSQSVLIARHVPSLGYELLVHFEQDKAYISALDYPEREDFPSVKDAIRFIENLDSQIGPAQFISIVCKENMSNRFAQFDFDSLSEGEHESPNAEEDI